MNYPPEVELLAGAPRRRGGGPSKGPNREQRQEIDRACAQQAEEEYRRAVADRRDGTGKEEVQLVVQGETRT